MSKGRAIPQDWMDIINVHEKRNNLPAGTLASLIQQETGLQQRFIDDPSAAHYSVGPNGEKPKSSARGLGGILEGTARDPGYGVAPLKDWSVPEQIRFMSDYVTARSKRAGGLEAGLAGYGEGQKYAQSVLSRVGKGNVQPDAPIVTKVPLQQPQEVPLAEPVQVASAPVNNGVLPVGYVAPTPEGWGGQPAMPAPVEVSDIQFGGGTPAPQINPLAYLSGSRVPHLRAFTGWKGKA